MFQPADSGPCEHIRPFHLGLARFDGRLFPFHPRRHLISTNLQIASKLKVPYFLFEKIFFSIQKFEQLINLTILTVQIRFFQNNFKKVFEQIEPTSGFVQWLPYFVIPAHIDFVYTNWNVFLANNLIYKFKLHTKFKFGLKLIAELTKVTVVNNRDQQFEPDLG